MAVSTWSHIAIALGDVRHLRQGIDPCRARGADAGHERTGAQSGFRVLGDGRLQEIQAKRVVVVGGDEPQMLPAKASQEGRFLDTAVALVRSVDHERGLTGLQSFAVLAVSGSPLPSAEKRREGSGAGGVVHHARPGFAQARHLAQPVHDHLLDLGRGRARLPAHALHAEARGHDVGQDGGVARIAREVGEETGVIPVGDAGHHVPVERGQRLIQLAALSRRMGGKRGPDLSRLNLAHDGQARQPLAVVGDPIDELVAEAAKFFGVHGVLQTAA